jgi:hypothetical protein
MDKAILLSVRHQITKKKSERTSGLDILTTL